MGPTPATGKTPLRAPLTPLVPSPAHSNLLKCTGLLYCAPHPICPLHPAATLLGVERDVWTQHVFPQMLGPNYWVGNGQVAPNLPH